MADFYTGFYCPQCGKALREVHYGIQRLAECIREHLWKLTREDNKTVLVSIERPTPDPEEPTIYCQYGPRD